jgi:hypothetical protein
MLRDVYWWLFTDVSGQSIGPIFERQAVQEDCLALEDRTNRLSDCLTLEDGTDWVSRNVGK